MLTHCMAARGSNSKVRGAIRIATLAVLLPLLSVASAETPKAAPNEREAWRLQRALSGPSRAPTLVAKRSAVRPTATPPFASDVQSHLLNPHDARPLEPVNDYYGSIDEVPTQTTLLYLGFALGRAW